MITTHPRGRLAALALLLTACWVLMTPHAIAAPSPAGVTMTVDRQSLSLDDDVRLEVAYSGKFDSVREPTFDGLQVIDQRQSQHFSLVNGRMSHEQKVTYTLQPTRAGVVKITGAAVIKGGQVVSEAAPVTLQVRKSTAPPPTTAAEARARTASARQSYFLQAETPRDAYYVGEPFVISWNFYFQRSAGVDSIDVVNPPKLEGLLAEELVAPNERAKVRDVRVGGRKMRMTARSVKLAVGLRPGEVVVDAVRARVTIGSFMRRRQETVKSRAFKLQILDVPTEGRPESYRDGAIGRFSLSASLRDANGQQPRKVRSGQRLILEVVISGEGNLTGIKAPALESSDVFEVQVLPSQGEDSVARDASGERGKRTFSFLISPLKPGNFTTPGVTFSSFDPSRRAYQTLEAPGTPIEVTGQVLTGQGSQAAYAGGDVSPLAEQPTLTSSDGRGLVGSWRFWLFLALPFLAWAWVELRHQRERGRQRDPGARRARRAMRSARDRLAEAERALGGGEAKEFYGLIARSVRGYLADRAAIPTSGLTHIELREQAEAVGYPEALVSQLIVEMENCDFARFSPAGREDAELQDTLTRVRALLQDLDTVKVRRIT